MQAIILAGGLGTRLRSVVSDRPKPMALVEGKPFLEYVLQGLKKSGIDDIIFAVGYKGGMVEEYFGDGSRFGIRARYAYEEELLGTAGAIKNAGKYVTDEQFFVLNGDTFYQMDFGKRCVEFWSTRGGMMNRLRSWKKNGSGRRRFWRNFTFIPIRRISI